MEVNILPLVMDPNFYYPQYVYLRGLPLMFSGWNGVYERTSELSDGAPVYYRKPHRMLIFIKIVGVKMRKYHGTWTLEPDNAGPGGLCKVYGHPQLPYGQWEACGLTKEMHPNMRAEVTQYRGWMSHIFK